MKLFHKKFVTFIDDIFLFIFAIGDKIPKEFVQQNGPKHCFYILS